MQADLITSGMIYNIYGSDNCLIVQTSFVHKLFVQATFIQAIFVQTTFVQVILLLIFSFTLIFSVHGFKYRELVRPAGFAHLVRPTDLSSWSVQLVHPAGPYS